MTTKFEEHKKAAAEAAQEAANIDALKRWLAAKRIPINEANIKGFKEEFGENLKTFSLSAEDFQFALDVMDTRGITPQRLPTKAELIDEICDLLKSPEGTGRGGKYSNFNIAALRNQMQHWEISGLTARRDEIVRAQRMVKQPLPELKQMVREAHADPGFPRLPKMIVPAGQVVAVPLDAAYIKKLEPWEIRRLARIYGQTALNARLAGQ